MKTVKWKGLGFILAILVILIGNLIGIKVMATEDGDNRYMSVTDDPPAGVLKGYTPYVERVKIGEHLEYWGGWVGVPFLHLVTDYADSYCCKKTYREMDGCKGLKICQNQS
ncbi:MAG: hypothetical protein WC699_13980 [Bacteroidales bacterium]|jgi:hypothetical protein